MINTYVDRAESLVHKFGNFEIDFSMDKSVFFTLGDSSISIDDPGFIFDGPCYDLILLGDICFVVGEQSPSVFIINFKNNQLSVVDLNRQDCDDRGLLRQLFLMIGNDLFFIYEHGVIKFNALGDVLWDVGLNSDLFYRRTVDGKLSFYSDVQGGVEISTLDGGVEYLV